jgi:hypothetical protein
MLTGLSFCGIGAYAMWKGFQAYRLGKLAQTIPTSKVEGIAMGPVEVVGSVESAGELLQAPLSGRPCFYWKIYVERYRSGKHAQWMKVMERSAGTPFALRDKTGAVLVDPKGAEIDIAVSTALLWNPKDDFVKALTSFSMPNAPISESYLQDYSGNPKNFDYKKLGIQDITKFERPKEKKPGEKSSLVTLEVSSFGYSYVGGSMRYTEWRIEPDMQLYILGTAGDNPYKEEASAAKGYEDVMIKKGESIPFFYISDSSDRKVEGKTTEGLLGLVFGAGFILFGVALMMGAIFS